MKVEWKSIKPNLEKGFVREGRTVLSHLLFECQRIRFGKAVVRAGLVGHVFTREEHRGKGLGRLVMEDALRRMERRGHDMGCVRIRVRRGEMSVSVSRSADLQMSARELIEHVFGFRAAPVLPGIKGSFLRTLFPVQTAHSWPLDEPE